MEITEKEKNEVLAKAKEYLKWEKSEVFKKEVEDAILNNDYEDLYDRFYTALAFGTAGSGVDFEYDAEFVLLATQHIA